MSGAVEVSFQLAERVLESYNTFSSVWEHSVHINYYRDKKLALGKQKLF